MRYTFIDNIYSAAGTEIETRSPLIELAEILHICPIFGGKKLQFPTQMKIRSPEDLKEQYREWVLSALEEDKNEMETKEC